MYDAIDQRERASSNTLIDDAIDERERANVLTHLSLLTMMLSVQRERQMFYPDRYSSDCKDTVQSAAKDLRAWAPRGSRRGPCLIQDSATPRKSIHLRQTKISEMKHQILLLI